MRSFVLILLALIVILAVGGFVYFSTVPMPAPTAPVEKTIPNDRLQQK